MIKFHKCNICKRSFKANQIGRIQIVKRLPKGKKEFWLCANCTKIFIDRIKDILPVHIEKEGLYEKKKNNKEEI
ncbi:MAG: hypothetical protein QXZ20_00025 [Candidatus Aenigmatarchaeota archaeon]